VAGWQLYGGEGLMHGVFVLASEFAIEWDKLWMTVSFIFVMIYCAKLNLRKRILLLTQFVKKI
jgi:hypothetical protein